MSVIDPVTIFTNLAFPVAVTVYLLRRDATREEDRIKEIKEMRMEAYKVTEALTTIASASTGAIMKMNNVVEANTAAIKDLNREVRDMKGN